MKTWIALLRGINVGGRNKLPMADLKQLLNSLGLEDVRTYIQSGNVVFRASSGTPSSLSDEIAGVIERNHGFRPVVLVLGVADVERALEANPFQDAEREPRKLHLFFLEEPVGNADLDGLAAYQAPTEAFELVDRVFYLHAPDGFGRSKLPAKVDAFLGVPTTARNYRTMLKVVEMAGEAGSS